MGMVRGLTLGSKDYNAVCKGCAFGKLQKAPFLKSSSSIYGKMDLVVVDLCYNFGTYAFFML